MSNLMTIALPKGRLGEDAMLRLNKIGWGEIIDTDSRKLIFEDHKNMIRYMLVKPSDVVTYVSKGVADLGIIGKDSILEENGEIYELMDLGFGTCKFAIAGKQGQTLHQKEELLKVATKYPKVTQAYFEERQQPIEIIKLNGSVELAPLVGLADVIVDIVETGSTLKANGLEVIEDIMPISAKLISNKVSYRFKYTRIRSLIDALNQNMEVSS